jgi:hypothetical protein
MFHAAPKNTAIAMSVVGAIFPFKEDSVFLHSVEPVHQDPTCRCM